MLAREWGYRSDLWQPKRKQAHRKGGSCEALAAAAPSAGLYAEAGLTRTLPFEAFTNVELRSMYERAATACAGGGARSLILKSRLYGLVTPFAMAEWRGVALVNRQMHATVMRCLGEARAMAASARAPTSAVDLTLPAWREVSARPSPVENMLRMLCMTYATSLDLMTHRASARWFTRLGHEPGEAEALYFNEPMECGRLLLEMANRAELALMQARFDSVDRYLDAAEAVALAAADSLVLSAKACEQRLEWLAEVAQLGAAAAAAPAQAESSGFAEVESASARTAVVDWQNMANKVDVLASGAVVTLPPDIITKHPILGLAGAVGGASAA